MVANLPISTAPRKIQVDWDREEIDPPDRDDGERAREGIGIFVIDWEVRDFVEAEKRTFVSFSESRGKEREPTSDAWLL